MLDSWQDCPMVLPPSRKSFGSKFRMLFLLSGRIERITTSPVLSMSQGLTKSTTIIRVYLKVIVPLFIIHCTLTLPSLQCAKLCGILLSNYPHCGFHNEQFVLQLTGTDFPPMTRKGKLNVWLLLSFHLLINEEPWAWKASQEATKLSSDILPKTKPPITMNDPQWKDFLQAMDIL